MKKIILFLSISVLSCNSNDNNDDVNCTEDYRAGLTVTVKDAVTQADFQEGVTVTATDGSYSEVLE
jgi:hypothetical protein